MRALGAEARLRAWLVALALGSAALIGGLAVVEVDDVLHSDGVVVDVTDLIPLEAVATGTVSRIFVSVGDHLDPNAPVLALDPNLSPQQARALESQLDGHRLEVARQERVVAAIDQVLKEPSAARSAPRSLGPLRGDIFALINDFYAARLDLEKAQEQRKHSATHQRSQTASEMALMQRGIDLARRNLEAGRREVETRELALAAKRKTFESLLKLSERGLVSASDVNSERDTLLRDEVAVSERRKQVDQAELEISNRTLEMARLQSASRSEGEDANARLDSAQLHFELRQARLVEERDALKRAAEALARTVAAEQATLHGGLGGGMVLAAPAAGVITQLRFLTPGDPLKAGERVGALQRDGTQPVVSAPIPAHEVGLVREGQRARVKINATSLRHRASLEAEVARIFADPSTGAFTAKLKLHGGLINMRGLMRPLLPGQSVRVELLTQRRSLLDVWLHP